MNTLVPKVRFLFFRLFEHTLNARGTEQQDGPTFCGPVHYHDDHDCQGGADQARHCAKETCPTLAGPPALWSLPNTLDSPSFRTDGNSATPVWGGRTPRYHPVLRGNPAVALCDFLLAGQGMTRVYASSDKEPLIVRAFTDLWCHLGVTQFGSGQSAHCVAVRLRGYQDLDDDDDLAVPGRLRR